MASTDESALDWIAANRKVDSEKSAMAMEKLGVDATDIDAWEWSKKNQNDDRSVDVRNKLFTKLSEGRRPTDTTKGFPKVERFLIKNLADTGDVKAIGNYMKDRGFITRVKGGEVQVRTPDQEAFVSIEPTDIDLFDFSGWAKEAAQDVTDVGRELIEGGVVALTTGAKAVSSLAGPLGLGVSSAVSGATMAGVETARQGLGQAVGVREGFKPGQVAQAGLIGAALPGVAGATGKALEKFGSAFGKVIGKFRAFAKKPDAEAIIKGAETLGARATPGQLFKSPGVQKLEESLVKSGDFQLGGVMSGLPKQVEINKRVIAKEAENLVKGRSFREGFDVGREVGKEITEQVQLKLEPAEKLYTEVAEQLGDISVDTAKLKGALSGLKKDMKFSDEGLSVLKKFEKKLNLVDNAQDLKQFRTSILDELPATASKNAKIASNKLYEVATKTRSDALQKAASKSVSEVIESDKLLTKFGNFNLRLRSAGKQGKLPAPDDYTIEVGGDVLGSVKIQTWNMGNQKIGVIESLPDLTDLPDPQRKELLSRVYAMASQRYGQIGQLTDDLIASDEAVLKKLGAKVVDIGNPLEPQDILLLKSKDLTTGARSNKALLEKLTEADSLYKAAAQDVEKALLASGKKLRLTPRQTVKEFLGKTPEIKRINKILDTGDPKKIQQLRASFPSVFETLKKQKIEDIARKAEVSGEINPKRLSNIIIKLPLRTQVLLFGAKGTRHAKALKSYLDSLPQPFNTSNTSNMNSFIDILNPLEQASSVARAALIEIFVNTQLGKSLVQRAGRGLQAPITKGAIVGGRNLLLPEQTPEGFLRVPEREK